MQISIVEPKHKTTMKPADLNRDGWLRLASYCGVAQSHELWMDPDASVLVHVVVPDSGPYKAMKAWPHTERPMRSWPLAGWDDFGTQFGASLWVMRHAAEAVMYEASVDDGGPQPTISFG